MRISDWRSDVCSSDLSWNAGAEQIFGYKAEEMIGQPIIRIIPAELRQEEEEILSKLRRGERIEHFETIRLGKNGRSEERRVGQACVSTCRYRRSPYH